MCSTNLFISVGPSVLFGDKTATCVCMCVCVFVVLQDRGIRVTVQFSETPTAASKKKRTTDENKMKAASAVSVFSHCYVLHICQNGRAEDVNNADNCLVDRFTRENCKRRGGSSTSSHAA